MPPLLSASLLDKVATVGMRGLKTWTKLNDAKGIIHSKTVFFCAAHEQTIVRTQLFEVTKINHIS